MERFRGTYESLNAIVNKSVETKWSFLVCDHSRQHFVVHNVKGYLQQPLEKYEKGHYNMKCCCQSHIVHRESDKFIIVNKAPHDAKISVRGARFHRRAADPQRCQTAACIRNRSSRPDAALRR